MVTVVGSIPTEATFWLKLSKFLGENSGLKCKCDLIMKNSVVNHVVSTIPGEICAKKSNYKCLFTLKNHSKSSRSAMNH